MAHLIRNVRKNATIYDRSKAADIQPLKWKFEWQESNHTQIYNKSTNQLFSQRFIINSQLEIGRKLSNMHDEGVQRESEEKNQIIAANQAPYTKTHKNTVTQSKTTKKTEKK